MTYRLWAVLSSHMLYRIPKSQIGAWPWITFWSVPLYLIPAGFYVCWHSKQGALRWSCVGKWQFPFFWLHIGHCLLIVARFVCQSSWPFVLSCMVLSTSKALSMAPRAWIWGFKISGPVSLFLLATSVFVRSNHLSEPVPYISPVAKDFGIEILRLLQNSNSWIMSSSLLASLTVNTYVDRSSAKAAWFHWGVLLMPCVIPVASSSRRRALRNRSNRRGESTDPCTVPVSNCMGAVHSEPTCIFIHELLHRASRKPTSGTPSPLRITQTGRSVLLNWRHSWSLHQYGLEYCSVPSLVVAPNGPIVLPFVLRGVLENHIGSLLLLRISPRVA